MDRLQFFAFSADKPAGKGVGDLIKDPTIYKELDEIKNWRRVFSSLWTNIDEPFEYQERKYISYEHAFQSAKFLCNGYEKIADKFSLNDLESSLARSAGLEASRNRKIIKLSQQELDLWESLRGKVKDELYLAKFTQVPSAKKALLGTNNAELWNKGPRIKEIRCIRLEKTRELLKN